MAWSTVINAHSNLKYRGFICIKHFEEDDLVIHRNKITLKKDAIPKLFEPNANIARTNNSNNLNNFAQIDPDNRDNSGNSDFGRDIGGPNGPNEKFSSAQCARQHSNENLNNTRKSCCNSFELNEILKAEIESLRQEYVELETKRCVEVASIQNEIEKLKANANVQKKHIKYLSRTIYKQEKSKESLQTLLKDLKEQSVLTAEAYDVLQVC